MFELKCKGNVVKFEAGEGSLDQIMNELCFGVAYAVARISESTQVPTEQLAAGIMYNFPNSIANLLKQKEEQKDAVKGN